jgi:hypothetical protein
MTERLSTLVVAAAVCAAPAATRSATLDSLEVTREHGRYELNAQTFLAASADDIYGVLLEYEDDKFQRISSVYKESAYLEPDADGTPIVYTRMEGCILFFCKSMKRVERLQTREGRYIRTDTLPEQSDFKYSFSEWTFEPAEGGTRMAYTLVMEPAFWVPPIVGPWIIKKILSTGGVRAITRIERMALGEEMPRRVMASE